MADFEQHAGCLRDEASGLPGQGIFYDRILHARQLGGRHSDPFVVAFMDVEMSGASEEMRDSRHAEAASQLAARIREPLRSHDTIAALGPLQFGFPFEGVPSLVAAYAVLTRALQDVSHPLTHPLPSGQSFIPEGRCGGAVATESLSQDHEVILRASAEFERARTLPSPALAIYDSERDRAALHRLRDAGGQPGLLRSAS